MARESTEEPTVLYETLHGSRAHGLAVEGSDTDLKGVVVGPRRWYFGYRGGPEQIDLGPDHVRYDLRKLLKLVAKANPTVLELLFTEPEDHRVMTRWGERLLAERKRFLTKRVARSYGGYAKGQLRRIEKKHDRQRVEGGPDYDPKDAMHLIRLQRMAIEILERGEVIVRRPDRETLLAIRRGEASYEALLEEARANLVAIETAAERSPLPAHPDEDAIEALGISIVDEVLAER
jgi:predicted nucleotidyltransferase